MFYFNPELKHWASQPLSPQEIAHLALKTLWVKDPRPYRILYAERQILALIMKQLSPHYAESTVEDLRSAKLIAEF